MENFQKSSGSPSDLVDLLDAAGNLEAVVLALRPGFIGPGAVIGKRSVKPSGSQLMSRSFPSFILSCATLVVLCASHVASAGLVTNGSFENTSNFTPSAFPDSSPGNPGSGGGGMIDYNTSVTGWSSPSVNYTNQTGYNFIFNPSTASTTGAVGYNGPVSLSGPGNGFNNGLGPSPDGGNFVGADGDARYNGAIPQTVSGLSAGQQYSLSFYWAGAQLSGAGGNPNESWQVSLGSETLSTPTVTLPSVGGFVPWQQATMTFTATSSSEVLSFLATEGGPFGGQPIILLDGVSLNATHEPSTLVLGLAGLAGLGFAALRKKFRRV
jgi:hypothetical protein